jgi:hypothetical protein
MNSVNHQIRLAARPSGLPETSDWEITTEPVPAPGPGEFVVAIGAVMEVGAVGRVTALELRGDRLLAATGQPCGSKGSAGRQSASKPARTGSRSTSTCAQASACGRAATSTASGRWHRTGLEGVEDHHLHPRLRPIRRGS